VGKGNDKLRTEWTGEEGLLQIELGINFKSRIELPGEHTAAFLIFSNTFHVNRNPVWSLQFGIIEIPDTFLLSEKS